MSNKRSLLFRCGAILLLVLIAACMMVVGRGHTVYFDNKAIEYQGVTYEAPYKVTVLVKGEQAAKLYEKERGSATNIGQNFEMTLRVMQDKGGSEQEYTYRIKLPYSMDGIVVNIPGFLAGLVYGVLQALQGGAVFAEVGQFLLDYLLAFTVLGLAGLAKKLPKTWGLYCAIIIAALARVICHTLAGVLFWDTAPWASFVYNITYLGPDTLICIVLAFMIAKPVMRIMKAQ